LANRMRALDSAIQLADDLQKNLNVVWKRTKLFNCKFEKLFKNNWNIKIFESGSILKDNSTIERILVPYYKFLMRFSYEKYLYNTDINSLKEGDYNFAELSKYSKIYIQTGTNFFKKRKPYKGFEPIDELQDKITEVSQKFNDGTIGIHIRRGDNIISRQTSTTDDFIEQMNQALNSDPTANFFLATDSIEVENQMKKRFGKCILTYNKLLSRSSEKGIQDALIDLWCLSKTKEIIGSFWSSFSITAAELGSIHVKIVKKKDMK